MKGSSATKAKTSVSVPLSACDLWDQQKNFFEQQGIEAWNCKVPFYITSNPYIANSYANIIIRFFQDCINNKTYKPLEPFYILELGAGSGAFGFYTIKRLLELQAALEMTTVSFVYVMTDFAEKNIQYWRSHPALQKYIQEGVLDFALYNIETDQEIKLLDSGKVFAKSDIEKTTDNTLIVLANYVFDTVSHDAFRVCGGKLQQGLIKQSSKIKPTDDKHYITLNELDKQFSYQDIQQPYYQDVDLDAIITHYAKKTEDHYFLIPIGSLRCIKTLFDVTKRNLLLIATDKGYSRELELCQDVDPGLALHASFSMMVNFHAIGQYFKQCSGDYYHQSFQQSIITSVFSIESKFNRLPETRQALAVYLNSFSHGNLSDLYNYIVRMKPHCPLDTLLSYFSMTQWDPGVFNVYLDMIIREIKGASPSVVYDLVIGMANIAANFYYLPGVDNTLANIGLFFQEIHDYAIALHYYQQSLLYFEKTASVLYNIGLCHYLLNQPEQALIVFRETVALAPTCMQAKGWISQIEMELAKNNKEIFLCKQ